jgi:aminotransferase
LRLWTIFIYLYVTREHTFRFTPFFDEVLMKLYSSSMQLNMIKQMERHARQDTSIVSLGQGIPAGRAAPEIHDYVTHKLVECADIDMYSDPLGLPLLRHMIAGNLTRSGMRYNTDEIIVTSGAIEALNAALLTLILDSTNEVILPTPTYSAYERAIHVARGTVVPLPLQETDNWSLDIQKLESLVTEHTAAVLLCNPNNPTGTCYDRATLARICQLAVDHNFVVILDEVYGNMIYGDSPLYTPAREPKWKDNIIRIVSFSKDFNLTGWRIGYLHSSQKLVERIVPTHDTLINCAPVVSQYAAVAALTIADSIISANRTAYTRRRQLMAEYLDSMPAYFSYVMPEGGYFFFPKLLNGSKAQEFCYDLLNKAQVIAIPGPDFGNGGEHHVRLCFGRSINDIHEGMTRIKRYAHRSAAS